MSASASSSVPGTGWAKPVFQMHKRKTLSIPMEVHKVNREKVCDLMRAEGTKGVMLLQGGHEQNQYDTDTELIFRQDSWFNYLFGTKEPGMYGAICISTGRTTLFVPRLPEWWPILCGKVHPPAYFQALYSVDEVLFVEELATWLQTAIPAEGEGASLYLLNGINSDSDLEAVPATFAGKEAFASVITTEKFFFALSTARVTKSPIEINVMQYCAFVASNAHVNVMRQTAAGMAEYELEAIFRYDIYKNGGCRNCAYTAICACGPNGATLHYGHAGAPNDRELEETDMALLDMGAEYHGYVSDITCTFPVSGKFTPDQRAIYEGVLSAQRAVLDAMKPGYSWPDCHRLAEREILQALMGVGILVGGTVDEMVEAQLGPVFFPHGLGHLIGCDTHDVGGYLEGTPARSDRRGLAKLRTARELQVGMTLTNEPGCYFIDVLLNEALSKPEQSKFINAEVLDRFRNFGGVRLEDVVVVTADGVSNLTTCPRTVSEIESVLSGGAWPPTQDEAPYLRRRWAKLSADCNTMEAITLGV